MCGIAGVFRPAGRPLAAGLDEIARRMTAALSHRGPDGDGFLVDERRGLALGHRRLSILDLSEAGRQPMVSAGGRFVAVLNGEIYNFALLREELERTGQAPAWRGRSDTEVVLAACEAWGVRATIERCQGMFALAIFDRVEGVLHLFRDRFGEKPLYFGVIDGIFLFASEPQALRAFPGRPGTVDRRSLARLLRYNCIPAPHTIWQEFRQLRPGQGVTVTAREGQGAVELASFRYWRLVDVARQARAMPFREGPEAAARHLEALLQAAVRRQMVAEVPVGAFLSGGIDSSLVVALMQEQSDRPVPTFTIGFDDPLYDETEQALLVASRLGTAHTDLRVSAAEAQRVIPDLPRLYAEPFADSSQIPVVLLARLARRQVTVCLSGDGGDEVFGGYTRYIDGARAWRVARCWPRRLRHWLAGQLDRIGATTWARLERWLHRWFPGCVGRTLLADKMPKLAALLRADQIADLYKSMVSLWDDPAALVIGLESDAGAASIWPASFPVGSAETTEWAGRERAASNDWADRGGEWGEEAWAAFAFEGEGAAAEAMMLADALGYLPDDLLVKLDRAAMSVGLETRLPYLDPAVVEFAWRLPLGEKIGGGEGKRILRRLLARRLPGVRFDRTKRGFAIPLGDWLRGPLRDWADDLLSPTRLAREGFLRPEPIQKAWEEHRRGIRAHHYRLWGVLCFEAWLEAQR